MSWTDAFFTAFFGLIALVIMFFLFQK